MVNCRLNKGLCIGSKRRRRSRLIAAMIGRVSATVTSLQGRPGRKIWAGQWWREPEYELHLHYHEHQEHDADMKVDRTMIITHKRIVCSMGRRRRRNVCTMACRPEAASVGWADKVLGLAKVIRERQMRHLACLWWLWRQQWLKCQWPLAVNR
jgi:hypothetical protein